MNRDRTDDTADASSDGSQVAENAKNMSRKYYRDGNRFVAATVQEQPLGSLVVAATVGFMLALIISR